MKLDQSFSTVLMSFVLMVLLSSASITASFISDDVLDEHPRTSRRLLQEKKGWPVDFKSLDYTVLTSRCKGPNYPADICCKAFKEFACPYADYLNDVPNGCADDMFYYINLYGKYPPGLFASECREGKEGLKCPSQDLYHILP